VIRRLVAAGLSVAIPVAALCAPFVHAHPDDHDTDHHRARSIHAHFSSHDSESVSNVGARIGDDDHDRAVFLQVFVAVAAPSFDVSFTIASVFELVAPPEVPAHVWVDAVYGHDPPTVASLVPRAPPAYLS